MLCEKTPAWENSGRRFFATKNLWHNIVFADILHIAQIFAQEAPLSCLA